MSRSRWTALEASVPLSDVQYFLCVRGMKVEAEEFFNLLLEVREQVVQDLPHQRAANAWDHMVFDFGTQARVAPGIAVFQACLRGKSLYWTQPTLVSQYSCFGALSQGYGGVQIRRVPGEQK